MLHIIIIIDLTDLTDLTNGTGPWSLYSAVDRIRSEERKKRVGVRVNKPVSYCTYDYLGYLRFCVPGCFTGS